MSGPSKMRLIALPLTKRFDGVKPLVYYYAQMPPPSPSTEKGYIQRGTDWAGKQWIALGKAPEDSWKHRIYATGQRVYRRIDFEELALQSVEPALGPKITRAGSGNTTETLKAVEHGEKVMIPLLHPTKYGPSSPLDHLSSLVMRRTPAHRKSMIGWLIAIPFTFPFALIPVIPNFPLFYCAWRAWSHWRAWRAADYLSTLIRHNVLVPTSSPTLDELYSSFPSTNTISQRSPSDALLLDDDGVSKLLTAFDLPQESGTEILIAIAQAKTRLEAEAKKTEDGPPAESDEKKDEKKE